MNSKNINTVKLPADEKLLLDIQRREKAILDERSAINFAENIGIVKGKVEGVDNLIAQFKFSLSDALNAMNMTENEYYSFKKQ